MLVIYSWRSRNQIVTTSARKLALVLLLTTLTFGNVRTAATTITVGEISISSAYTEELPRLFASKAPGIEVHVSPGIRTHDQIQGSGLDLVKISPIDYDILRREGQLLPLDPYFIRKGIAPDDLFAFNVDAWRFNGSLYGVPYSLTTGAAMAYNRDLFDGAGLAYPHENWTWDDLLTAAQTLTRDVDGDGRPDHWGILGDFTQTDIWLTFVWQNGGHFYNYAETQILDSPASIEAIEFMQSLRFDHGVLATPEEILDRAYPPFERYERAFATGKVGMFFVPGAGMVQFIASMVDFDWSTAPIPYNTEKAMGAQQLLSYAINIDSEHPFESFEYLWFLLTDREALRLQAGSYIPATRQGYEVWLQETDPGLVDKYRGWLERLPYARPKPYDRRWPVIANALAEPMSNIFNLGHPVRQAITEARDSISKLLQQFRSEIIQQVDQ